MPKELSTTNQVFNTKSYATEFHPFHQIVPFGEKKKIKTHTNINILMLLSRPALSSSTEEQDQIRYHLKHINLRLHNITEFGLTRIPQLVMNIDYKLQPIANKNVRGRVFSRLRVNS